MTGPAGQPDLGVGRYAQREVELASAARGEPLELSLAAPFGALFSALFGGRPLRVRSLALTYVSSEQLGPSPTFSVKLTELREGGEAQLSLLVFRGARVCVRGEAVVAFGDAGASSADAGRPAASNGQRVPGGGASGEKSS